MPLLFDSFWRAVAYCLRPRVIVLSLLPLLIMVGLSVGLGYFFWDAALDQVRMWLDALAFSGTLWNWLENMGAGALKTALAPLLIIFAITPLIVVVSMLVVSLHGLFAPSTDLAPNVSNHLFQIRFSGSFICSISSLMSSGVGTVRFIFFLLIYEVISYNY